MQSLLFSFQGRINRAKFWLVHVVMWVVVAVVSGVVVGDAALSADPEVALRSLGTVPSLVLAVLYVLLVWIGLAAGVKRWHDRNKSGLWILIALVPVIGGLWYLIECGFLRGTVGPNTYGPDPLVLS
ncbi:DUF805 domain-containing protein [Reyranella sp.]|uniref:DUF805 domain-containing protein n=1 Tax=Reyranella sp. TaxID=1929291 RepID=UPI00273007E2|nr:DUF805 domain-containing protein [Reyranella sp.]MDP2372740.1 DUF805 domain-containing protein [Reyranella sp.]